MKKKIIIISLIMLCVYVMPVSSTSPEMILDSTTYELNGIYDVDGVIAAHD